jgi:hypothetical protein
VQGPLCDPSPAAGGPSWDGGSSAAGAEQQGDLQWLQGKAKLSEGELPRAIVLLVLEVFHWHSGIGIAPQCAGGVRGVLEGSQGMDVMHATLLQSAKQEG